MVVAADREQWAGVIGVINSVRRNCAQPARLRVHVVVTAGTEGAFGAYNAGMQQAVKKTVWVTGGCTSWYKRGGVIANNWGGSCLSYWMATARVDWRNYEVR